MPTLFDPERWLAARLSRTIERFHNWCCESKTEIENIMKRLVIPLGVVLSIVGVYAAQCFISSSTCVCVNIGDCYGSDTPTGCSTPTCIIADEQVWIQNICSGAGSHNSRTQIGNATCPVEECRIYNSCTFQYENPPNGCEFEVPRYQGVGNTCTP